MEAPERMSPPEAGDAANTRSSIPLADVINAEQAPEVPRAEQPGDDDGSAPEHLELSARQMTATNALGGTFGLGLDQFELPKAPVIKLARGEVPDSVQLRKEFVTALVKSSSVFISYLAGSSHDVAIARGNKTITAPHVLDALRELDFPAPMRRELREQLEAYRALQKEKNAAAKEAQRTRRARKEAGEAEGEADAEGGEAREGESAMDVEDTGDTAGDAAGDADVSTFDPTAADESGAAIGAGASGAEASAAPPA